MVESRLQGLLDLGLTDEAVADMLSRVPALLGYQSEQLRAMQECLGGLAGFSRADVASLLQKKPHILGYSWPGIALDVVDFLRGLGIEGKGILRLLSKLPSLAALSVERRLRPAVSTLMDMGLSRANIARKVVQQPQLLYCKPERYREILGIMQGHGTTLEVAKKALGREPAFILRSANTVEHHLQSIQQLTDPPLDLNTVLRKGRLLRSTLACHVQTVLWLRTNLQLSETELRRCLSRSPSILERSSEAVSRMVVEFTEAGFTREDFKHIVHRHPNIFGLSYHQNMLLKLLLLQELRATDAGEIFSEEEIRRLVVKYPMVLTLSLANIESKLKYLVDELQREGREILTCPSYLASSMESKIVPR